MLPGWIVSESRAAVKADDDIARTPQKEGQ